MKRLTQFVVLAWILLTLSILRVAMLSVNASVDNYSLFGSAGLGWGFTPTTITSPGPSITVAQGDTVNLTLTSADGFSHLFYVDYNGNGVIDTGEPASPTFSGTINFQFNATTVGTFTYYCAIHPNIMHGTFTVVSTASPDVAVTNVSAEKIFVGQGQSVKSNVTVVNDGNVDETFNVTLYRMGGAVRLMLNGSASAGWNNTIPGPSITVNLGDTVALTLVSLDGLTHQFFVDYNGNLVPDPGEPTSQTFSTTTTYIFVAKTSGTYNYYCTFHPAVMHGTFTVTSASSIAVMASETVSPPLAPGESRIMTFSWNSGGVGFGNYSLKAVAGTVANETNTTNNNFTDGTICVTIPGDVNGDFKVGLTDLVLLANAYGSTPGVTKWNPNADINDDGIVGLTDLVLLATHYEQQYP